MLPNKLQHGDSFARLFDLWNQLIDYLRETRLVAGNGIRINRLSAGTTIESTATAGGAASSLPPEDKPHPFDVAIINKGTEENPDYYARVYDSSFPDSQTAGLVFVGQYDLTVPVTELKFTTSGYYYIWLVIKYDDTLSPPFDLSLNLYPDGTRPPEAGSDTAWTGAIARVLPPMTVSTYYLNNISVSGRWT